jgi:tetratricopeptide (TPR) repeat protein
MEVNIFVSYSHRDKSYLGREELLGFLRGMEQDGEIRFWVDENLSGGIRWDDEIRGEISKAHIALVLVSQAFLDSAYCMDVELAAFLNQRRKEGLRIFPIILSPCEWERHSWLAEHQSLPGGDETIEEHYQESGQRKRLYLKIRKELRSLVEELKQRPPRGPAPAPDPAENLAERRRVTLLYCSLDVDDAELTADDRQEVLYEGVRPFREICMAQIQAFDGHVVDQKHAGGVLACFGYPAAHEDESIRAVRAGIAIVGSIRKLGDEFLERLGVRLAGRVSIQTGTVICSSGARAEDEFQQGDTHSIVMYLHNKTSLNTILMGDATHKLIHGFFETKLATESEHPGLRQTIRGWQVVTDLGVRTRFEAARLQGLTPMVGRDTELSLILDSWKSAVEGSGKIVGIAAEAGVGKSRLLEEIKRSVAGEAGELVEFQCSQFHQNSALFPVVQALNHWLSLPHSPEIKKQKLDEVAKKAGLPDTHRLLLADLLSIPLSEASELKNLTAKQHKERMMEAILLLLLHHAEESAVLIVVEDLHWMDPSTEELLTLLGHELPACSAMAVCTYRPEYHPPQSWAEQSSFVPVKLGPLSRAQVADMVLRITGEKKVPPDVVQAIFDKTEGYPLFVEDLTRMVIESDLLEEREGVYVLRKSLHSLAVPDTLQETLMARLSRAEGARVIAQLGAVIGREFTYPMIKAISPLDEEMLKEALGKLVAAGLLHRRGLLTRANYSFKHSLVQDALYESLLKRERKRYHKMIAQLLDAQSRESRDVEPDLLAHHHFQAGACEAAARYWLEAGKKAIHNSANLEAIRHATNALNALAAVPHSDERDRLELAIQTMQCPALLAVRGRAAVELWAAFERAKTLSQQGTNTRQIFQITRGLWAFCMESGQLDKSITLAQELMDMAVAEKNEDYFLEAHAAFCDSNFWMGRPVRAAEHSARGLEIYNNERHHLHHSCEYGEDPSAIFLCYGAISNWLMGNIALAEQILARALATVELYTQSISRVFVLYGITSYYHHVGNPELTLRHGTVMKKIATENDMAPWRAVAQTQCGWATAALGKMEAGVAELLAGISEWKAGGSEVTFALNYTKLADLYLHQGNYDEAMKYVTMGLNHVSAAEEGHYRPELHRIKAELLRKMDGSCEEVESHYRKAMTIAKDQGAVVLEQKAASGLWEFLQERDRVAKFVTA